MALEDYVWTRVQEDGRWETLNEDERIALVQGFVDQYNAENETEIPMVEYPEE